MGKLVLGAKVYRPPSNLTVEQVKDRTQWPANFKLEPVRAEKLKVGEILLVPGWGESFYLGKVHASPKGEPFFQSLGGSVTGALGWNQDDHRCWTCDIILDFDDRRPDE